jgi:hypothetical protein
VHSVIHGEAGNTLEEGGEDEDGFRDDREVEHFDSSDKKDRTVALDRQLQASQRRGFVDLDIACIYMQPDDDEGADADRQGQDVRLPPFRVYFKILGNKRVNKLLKRDKSMGSNSLSKFSVLWNKVKSKVRDIGKS